VAKPPKALPSLEWLEPRVRLSRIASLICFFALVALLVVYYLIFADLHGARPWVILGIELVPLLVLAPGMLIGSARGHSWTCFAINLEMIASLAVFVSALLYVRWRYQYNRKLASVD
jgi:uncharacterized membrane protein